MTINAMCFGFVLGGWILDTFYGVLSNADLFQVVWINAFSMVTDMSNHLAGLEGFDEAE